MKQIIEVISEIQNGKYKNMLKEIYLDESMSSYQETRYRKALERYSEIFGNHMIEIYSTPGRSEVGGNHTDHQHGRVLAASINLDAIAVVSKNQDNIVKVASEGYPICEVNVCDLEKKSQEEGTSAGLIRGVLAGLKNRGYGIGGFYAYITSDVLIGAGLSSSAAFEVLIGTIISGLYNDLNISMVEIAQVSQFAENVYFGKPCGLMDQTACAVGGLVSIDFADPVEPVVKKVNVDFEEYDYSLCIIDTKGAHDDLTEDYAQVPEEMKKVAEALGKRVLREVDEKEFYDRIAEIREKTGDRAVLRAIHFLKENVRVASQVDALESGEFSKFLELVGESGNSSYKYLQNIYTNKDVQNQSMSIALAISESVLGENGVSRVHGGGFAGTIQAFVKNDFVDTYKKVIESIFGERTCHVLKVRKHGGMKVIS